MKKMMLPLQLMCAAMLISFGISAQNAPTYLGTAGSLKSQLTPNANNTAKSTALTIQTDDKQDLTIEVKHQAGNSLIGRVQQHDQSDFFIEFNGNTVKGNIILKAEKLAYKIYSDDAGNVFLEETDINKVLCVEHPQRAAQNSARTQAATPDNVYALQSLPGATAVAYLDFDGEYVVSSYWNGGDPIDALPSGMTDDDIYLAWQITSEDFRPFNINITTDVNVFNAAPVGQRMRVIVTPTWTAMPNSGGVAYIGSFTWTNDVPCWSFTSGVGTGGKNIGEVSSHELGHTLGLVHDGRDFPDGGHEEYYGGQGDWAPIMGVAYGAQLGQWSQGEYQYANNLENDVQIITSQNGFTYRADEYGNTLATAGNLQVSANGQVNAANNYGIITQRTDLDVLKFTTTGGQAQLDVNPSEVYPDLNISATLLDAQGVTIQNSNPTGSYGASISVNLTAGTYYLRVDGVGQGDPVLTGYSDYASIGEYTISGGINGYVDNQHPVVVITAPASNATFNAGDNITIEATATDADGTIGKVSFYVNNNFLGDDATAPYSITWNNASAGQYVIKAIAYDNLLATGEDTSFVTVIGGDNCVNTPAWSATTTYAAPGNKVTYQGNLFENKWWTLNDVPNINDQWGVWKFISACTVNNPSFILPVENDEYPLGGTLPISLNTGPSVVKVEFYLGSMSNKVGEDLTSPFSITYSPIPPATSAQGNYLPVIAKITDNNGGIVVISTFIRVTPGTNPCNSIPQYVENGGYNPGSIVKNVNKRYECKPWPYSGWCNSAAVAYAPGTGTNWQDAWIELGACGASAQLSAGSSSSSSINALTVSPNPANASIKVEYPQHGNATLQLSDAMGNQILLQEFTTGNTLDLSTLPAGVYILQIRTEGEYYAERIVKY